MSQKLTDALAQTTAATANVRGINESILNFINTGIPALIQVAVDEAAALGATPEELAPFAQVGADLTAQSQGILDAINQNNPQARRS